MDGDRINGKGAATRQRLGALTAKISDDETASHAGLARTVVLSLGI